MPVPVVDKHSVESGDFVTLPCEYPPGRLASYYSAYWTKIVANYQYRPKNMLLTQQTGFPDIRLTINSTELSNENTQYICVVTVVNSQSTTTNDWKVYCSPIILIVYGKH